MWSHQSRVEASERRAPRSRDQRGLRSSRRLSRDWSSGPYDGERGNGPSACRDGGAPARWWRNAPAVDWQRGEGGFLQRWLLEPAAGGSFCVGCSSSSLTASIKERPCSGCPAVLRLLVLSVVWTLALSPLQRQATLLAAFCFRLLPPKGVCGVPTSLLRDSWAAVLRLLRRTDRVELIQRSFVTDAPRWLPPLSTAHSLHLAWRFGVIRLVRGPVGASRVPQRGRSLPSDSL